MPTVNFSPIGNDAPFVDSSGNPLTSGELYTYTAGSATPEATYTTSAGSVQNANPIILGSNGYPSSGGNVIAIWLTQGVNYKFLLKNSAGTTLWTRDNVSGINDPTAFSAAGDQWVASGLTPTYISATSFSLVGDQTTQFHAGRRLKTANTGGTIYSRIVSAAFGAVTTVTVANDTGTLDSGLSAVSYGILTAINPSAPVAIDTYPLVSGSSDKTKLVRLEVDGLTTATTRVLTVPDADGTIALVGSGTSGRLVSETFYTVVTSAAVTLTIASPCVVTPPAGQLPAVGSPVVFSTTGSLPTGLTAGTTYFIAGVDTAAGTFSVSATLGGAEVNTSGGQSGTHSIANPTYNKATNNPTFVEVEMVAAGGGGGGVSAVAGAAAGGGGAGGYIKARVLASDISSGNITVTINAGGSAGSNAGGDGGAAAGTTTIALVSGALTCSGGLGGIGSTGASASKRGGNGGSNGYVPIGAVLPGQFLTVRGMPGGNSTSTAAAASSAAGNGASSQFGGGGSGPAGATGPGVNASGIGVSGAAFGSGGGGALGATANVGGIGAPGCILLREYI